MLISYPKEYVKQPIILQNFCRSLNEAKSYNDYDFIQLMPVLVIDLSKVNYTVK